MTTPPPPTPQSEGPYRVATDVETIGSDAKYGVTGVVIGPGGISEPCDGKAWMSATSEQEWLSKLLNAAYAAGQAASGEREA